MGDLCLRSKRCYHEGGLMRSSLQTFWLKYWTLTKSGLGLSFVPKACIKSSNYCCPAASSTGSNYLELNPIHWSASSKNKVKFWQAVNRKEKKSTEGDFKPLNCLFILNSQECWLLTFSFSVDNKQKWMWWKSFFFLIIPVCLQSWWTLGSCIYLFSPLWGKEI